MRRRTTDYRQHDYRTTRGKGYAVLKALRFPALILAAVIVFSVILGNAVPSRYVDDGKVIDISSHTGDPSYGTSSPINDPSQPPTEVPSVAPGTVFRVGDSDELITDIQSRLMYLGYLESDEPSEYFGRPLQAAVMLFQRANNMVQTGEVDPLLISLLYSETPAQYVIEFGNTGDDVRKG